MNYEFGCLPQISRVTEFSQNETLQIYGEGINNELIDSNSRVFVWYPAGKAENTTPFDVEAPMLPPDDSIELEFDSVFNQVAYVAPSKHIRKGVAVIWVKNRCGYSKPFVANTPQIFNCSHEKAIAGDLVHFAGSALDLTTDNSHNRTLLLYNAKTNEKYYISSAFDQNYCYNRENYIVEFIIPDNISNGNYKAYIHNGNGAEFGWSDSVDFEIYSEQTLVEFYCNKCFDTVNRRRIPPLAKTIIIDAPRDGFDFDMSDIIQDAIDKLVEGGVVKLTQGAYAVSKTIILKNGVVLKGAGKGNTVIRAYESSDFLDDWSDIAFARRHKGLKRWANDWRSHYEDGNAKALVRLTENCGLEDLCIEFGNGANIGVMVANKNKEYTSNVFLNNVTVDACYKNTYNSGDPHANICIGLSGVNSTDNMVVYNSTLKAITPIMLLPARNRHLKLIHNHIECSPAQVGESFVAGIVDSVIMGNTFCNGRRSLVMQDGCNNNLFYQNRSRGVSRSQNAQEQYMSEFGEGIWHGYAISFEENSMTVADIEDICPIQTMEERLSEYNLYIAVLGGKGFGQYRRIIGHDGNKIIVDKAWKVIPNEETFITIVTATANNIYLNNNSENGNGPTNISWGCGIENIVVGHETVLSYAMCLHNGCCCIPTDSKRTCEYGLSAFNRLIGGQFKASGMGIRTDTLAPNIKCADEFFDQYKRHYGLFGTVIKNNALEGEKSACYLKNQSAWIEENYNSGMELGGAYNLVERNLISGYANAIKLRYNCEGNYFAKNKFLYCENNFVFEVKHNNFGYYDGRVAGPDSQRLWFV